MDADRPRDRVFELEEGDEAARTPEENSYPPTISHKSKFTCGMKLDQCGARTLQGVEVRLIRCFGAGTPRGRRCDRISTLNVPHRIINAHGMASKYDPLKKYLLEADRGAFQMSFSDIERVLGFPLPNSARRHDAWWRDESAGTTHVQAKAWLEARRRVERLDRSAGIVGFSAVSRP